MTQKQFYGVDLIAIGFLCVCNVDLCNDTIAVVDLVDTYWLYLGLMLFSAVS